ncbi:MAG: PQQ-binding-like beta-propeller repeat protein [Planctomycetes bacterium]|nr:PQQ-binding-like beta-propeller repeat protein [Planctomycetota bacterium]
MHAVRWSHVAWSLVLGAVVCGVNGGTVGHAADPVAETSGTWPQFLGPNRNGISAETGLLTEWPSEGPREVWRVPGGIGMSGLAIQSGRVLTLVQKADRQWLVCLEAQTGKTLWERDLAPEYKNAMGNGPRATPTIVGDTAYVFTGEGILAAVQVSDGKVVWQENVVAELEGQPAEYGMACSPVVTGNLVVVVVGAPQATVAAFDRKTGALKWKQGTESPAGYSSPSLLKLADREQVVVFHGTGALALDPERGYPLWSFPYLTDFNCNIATPIAVNGGVLLSAGENHGSVLLKIFATGTERQYKVTPLWESFGPSSVLRSEWQTAVAMNGSLYGFDNVGGAGPVSHLTCIEAATGKRQWQQLRFGKGNLIAADGKLFVSTLQGELVVAKVNPEKYEELGRKAVVGKNRQAPALAGGMLYLRDDREIVCLDVRKK